MLDRAFAALARVLAIIAGTGLFVMMLLTFVDVVGRYGFNNSIFGASEMIEYLMIATIFSGLAFVTATNDHITVTMFDGLIERWMPGLRRWAVIVASWLIYALMTWHLIMHGLQLLDSGKRSPVLDLPVWIMPLLGGALSVIGLVLLVYVTFRSRGRLDRVSADLTNFDRGTGRDVDVNQG